MSGKENAPGFAKGDRRQRVRGHTGGAVVVVVLVVGPPRRRRRRHVDLELGEFIVGSQVENMDSPVFTAGGKGISIAGHKVDAVDISRVSHEGLHGRFRGSNVPDFGGLVDTGGHKDIFIRGTERHEIDVFLVFGKGIEDGAAGNVPPNAGGISTGRQDLGIVQEPTAGNESIVGGHFHGLFRIGQFVDGAKIVESSTGHHFSFGLFVSHTHDVGRLERNRLDFVGGDRIPNEQIAILSRRDEVTGVSGPVDRGDFSEVSFEGAPHFGGGGRSNGRQIGRLGSSCRSQSLVALAALGLLNLFLEVFHLFYVFVFVLCVCVCVCVCVFCCCC